MKIKRIRNKKLKNQIFFYNKINSISKIFLSSFLVVSFFYITPLIISFMEKNILNTKEFTNNSKSILAYTLNKKDNFDKEGDILDEKELLLDIFSLNDLETDTVRLSASTIKQLFEDTGYNLKDVREKKLVKPVALTLLPNEIKMIENTKKRKELFIQIILPLVLDENKKIRLARKTLFSILNKNNNTQEEKNWLKSKFKQYGVVNRDLATLKIRMDEVPVSLAIAQAAKETGWGTSRFAQEGNALFGVDVWDNTRCGIAINLGAGKYS